MKNSTLTLFLVLIFMTTLVCHKNLAKAQVVEKGLVGYWTLNEADVDIKGKIAKDIFGNNDGAISGAPKVVEGKVGEALDFDGDDDHILVDNETINSDWSEVTLECWVWVKALDDSWNRIIALDDSIEGDVFMNLATLFYDDDDDQYGWCVTAQTLLPNFDTDIVNKDIPTEQWVHMVGTYDGKVAEYYENGELKKDYSLSEEPTAIKTGQPKLCFSIATRSEGAPDDACQAIIDEVRLYNRALSKAEVQQNMIATGLAVVNPSKKLTATWGEIKASRR